MDYSYLALIVVTLAIGLGAQAYVNGKLSKYSTVPNSLGITGALYADEDQGRDRACGQRCF